MAEAVKWWQAGQHRSKDDRTQDDEEWRLLVELVQEAFHSGTIPQEPSWATVVILPKLGGGKQGIGLVEVLWKLISVIIGQRLQRGV